MMLLSQAAQVLAGRMIGPDVRFSSVSTDSRSITQGDLFIALRGERFDGYEYAAAAIKDGAAAAMVNAESIEAALSGFDPSSPILIVEDTRFALGRLAAWWRRQFDIPLVAITGSNGKTTVKEMLATILQEAAGGDDAVLSTRGNLNNDIGMPLTLLRLNRNHRYAVIEMGMNHAGEIDYLTRIAEPDIALINNASGAHLEGLGSVEAVARAKGEIFAGLKHNGTAVINADDAHAPLWRSLAGASQLLEFGMGPDADVSGSWQPHGTGLHLDVTVPQGMFSADLQVPGEHNARNAIAATAAASALNIPLDRIAGGLERFTGVKSRLQYKPGRAGITLIDDTYNANPASMHAAIDVLAGLKGKRILVMGDMGELGSGTAAFHAEAGREASKAGIDRLYALGEMSRHAVNEFGRGSRHFDRIEDLEAALEKELDAGTTILVKGSRFMKMERVVGFLEAGSDTRKMEKTCC